MHSIREMDARAREEAHYVALATATSTQLLLTRNRSGTRIGTRTTIVRSHRVLNLKSTLRLPPQVRLQENGYAGISSL